jgi:hypothetical protein
LIPAAIAPQPAYTFTLLPPELHLQILDKLDECTSACPGLTAKKFYNIHKYRHPKTSLLARESLPRHNEHAYLFQLLKVWAGVKLSVKRSAELERNVESIELMESIGRMVPISWPAA